MWYHTYSALGAQALSRTILHQVGFSHALAVARMFKEHEQHNQINRQTINPTHTNENL
jgi:hypothetical protein